MIAGAAAAAGQLLVVAGGARSSGGSAALPSRPLALLLLLLFLCLVGAEQAAPAPGAAGERRRVDVDVGVILDRTTWLGNISWACMELALQDFYADDDAGYSSRVRLHLRDAPAGPSAVDAASAGTYVRTMSCFISSIRTRLANKSTHCDVIESACPGFMASWEELTLSASCTIRFLYPVGG
jgi:hypothetical protein